DYFCGSYRSGNTWVF
nr:immunoglobulin light chain junction region [Macaca mulatta]